MRSAAKRKGDLGVLHLLLVRARVLLQLTIKVIGKSIVKEKEARARHPSTDEDIIAITGKEAVHEVGPHGNTAVAKRNRRASANLTVTLKAELLVGISLQNVVENIQKRGIGGSEDLPVLLLKGTVRRTENVRRESLVPVDHQGGFYFILMCVCSWHMCCVVLCIPFLSESFCKYKVH